MPTPLHIDNRVEELKKSGCTVISHIKLEDGKEADKTGSNPLGVYIEDGFYRVVQVETDNTVADAAWDGPQTKIYPPELRIRMNPAPNLQSRIWKVTRQYGVKNTFTVVPVTPVVEPLQSEKTDQLPGQTATTKSDSVYIKHSSCYPIWHINCEEQLTYSPPGAEPVTVNLFRVYEVATKRCWKTDEQSNVVIAEAMSGRPPANQLYELVRAVGERTITERVDELIHVKAQDANPVKKYYFGTQISDQNLLKYMSIQLQTDARDQGWASSPEKGLWSWFELSIFTKQPGKGQLVTPDQIKRGPNGLPLTWLSHRLPLSREFQSQDGPIFERDHEIWRYVKQGDWIGVLVCAQFPLWEAEARSGKFTIKEMVIEHVK